MTSEDLSILVVTAVVVITLIAVFYNRFMLSSFNPALAAVRGVPVKALDYLFVILITVVTVASVKSSALC